MFNSGAAARAVLRLFAALLFAAFPAIAAAQEAPVEPPDGGLPSIVAVQVSTTPQRARLILDLTAPTEFATVSLDAPIGSQWT